MKWLFIVLPFAFSSSLIPFEIFYFYFDSTCKNPSNKSKAWLIIYQNSLSTYSIHPIFEAYVKRIAITKHNYKLLLSLISFIENPRSILPN